MKLTAFKGAALASAVFLLGAAGASAENKVAGAISAGKLAKDAKDFYGRTVTVQAEVEDVLGNNMFTLDEDSILAGADVLVLVPGGVTGTLNHDQKVVVTGEVRPFVEADLDRDFDWFDNGKLVDVKTKVDWKTRPVIIAHSIRSANGGALMSDSTRTTTTMASHDHGAMATSTGTANLAPISAGKLAKDAKHYYGQTVSVKAEVEDVLGPNIDRKSVV